MKNTLRLTTIASTLLLSIACTKATPKLDQLKSLSGLTVTNKNVSIKSGESVSLIGKCTKVFDSIEVSFDKGNMWYNLIALDSNQATKCTSDGSFTAQLSSSNSIFSSYLASNPSIVTVSVRGSGQYGRSNVEEMTVSISYTTAEASPGQSVTSGYHSGTAGTYKIKGHIKNFGVSEITHPSGVKLKGTLVK